VVLPFVNLSGDPAEDYFSDAMTDEIITNLAALAPDALAVIARTTAMHYKGSHKDVARIGRELGVDYTVEGSVRRNDGHIAINVQLIRVSNQTHLFAKTYGGELEDVFRIQRSIAYAIAAQIPVFGVTLDDEGSAVAAVTRSLTADLAAYNEYIQGLYLMGKATLDAFEKARQHQEQAIARDPEFAAAYDALAELYWYLGYAGFVSPREAFSRGIVYALRAIEIDNTRGETHALLGQFHKTIEYNWTEVEREMALALRLAPRSPVVRVRYALSGLMPHGRLEEAVAELERALELDPLSFLARFWLGIMLLLWRRYDRAIEEQRKLLELDPTHWGAYYVMHACYRYQGMLDDAVAAQRRAVDLSGESAHNLGALGLSLAEAGQSVEAREVLRRLHSKAVHGYVPPTSFAFIHLGLRETDAGFSWLDRAVEECDQRMMPIKSYRFFDPIRTDPRFLGLLRKMHLDGCYAVSRGEPISARLGGHTPAIRRFACRRSPS
jgi:TolB-like protein/Tfp pilus assembly protein PilF